MLQQIKKAGYDDIESRIRYERVITPADWDSRYEIYRGATFNLAHTLIRCCTFARTTASKTSTACISSAAARIPAAVCR